jgi:hypothetical protein
MEPRETYPAIISALLKAEEKFPGWPKDIVHGAAIIQEECGELVKASLNFYYGRRKDKWAILREALQTGAMVFRFLMHLDDYQPEKRRDDGPAKNIQ